VRENKKNCFAYPISEMIFSHLTFVATKMRSWLMDQNYQCFSSLLFISSSLKHSHFLSRNSVIKIIKFSVHLLENRNLVIMATPRFLTSALFTFSPMDSQLQDCLNLMAKILKKN